MDEIRKAQPGDWPMIQRFIDRNYGSSAPYKGSARWQWQFCDSPGARATGLAPTVWIAVQGGEVTGQLAVQPGALHIAGAVVPIGWVVDVMVDAAHRGRGLGHAIHDAIVAAGVTLVTLTMAEATRRIAVRAGAITLGPVHQMIRPGRLSGATIATLLRRIAHNRPRWQRPIQALAFRPVAKALAATTSFAARAHRSLARRASAPLGVVRPMAGPNDSMVDRLAARMVSRGVAQFNRDAAFFRWRFHDVPDLRYAFAAYERDGEVAGLLITRVPEAIELSVATLVDILADPDDREAIDALTAHAVRSLSQGADAIIAGAAHPAHIDALKRNGFYIVKTHRPTVVTTDARVRALIAGYAGPWHMSKADHDWDQIHPADH